jgi:aspartyl-tRNA synthetase
MASEEIMLRDVYQAVKEKHGEEIKALFGTEITVPEVPFPRIPMREAIEILKGRGYTLPTEKKGDIDPAGEREIAAYVKEKYNHDFVFLTDWPITVRPFYHMRYDNDPTLTKSYDLIANGLEITTGAQREHRPEKLIKQAQEKGLHLEPIQFYIDFFRYGCPPHGGYGMGLSRLMMVMLGMNNIRDAVYLFRGPTRLNP